MNEYRVESPVRVLVCIPEHSVQVDKYIEVLESIGCMIDVCSIDQIADLASNGVAAILVFAPYSQAEIISAIGKDPFTAPSPLIITITSAVVSLPTSAGALTLPDEPRLVIPQILLSLRMYAENAELRQRVKEVTAERDSLMEMVEAQQRAKHAVDLLKNAIVRNVSHELRTPLLQIKAAVSLIAEEVDNPELVSLAKASTARLETLVKNITMLGSSLELNRSAVIVHETIEYAKRNLSRIWEQKAAINRIKTSYTTNIPPVYADKVGIGTVIQLLVDNALKFSNGVVTVAAEKNGNEVVFEIRDSGIGIPDSQLERIFELFYQIESSTTRKYGGTGIGLALAKLILENHQTEIHVRSKVGKGTVFAFSLPTFSW